VANMSRSTNRRILRVAVKDRSTNLAMVQILRIVLAEIAADGTEPPDQTAMRSCLLNAAEVE
jgi:hypothetical protein